MSEHDEAILARLTQLEARMEAIEREAKDVLVKTTETMKAMSVMLGEIPRAFERIGIGPPSPQRPAVHVPPRRGMN